MVFQGLLSRETDKHAAFLRLFGSLLLRSGSIRNPGGVRTLSKVRTDGSGHRPSRASGGTEDSGGCTGSSKRSASRPGRSPSRPHPVHSLPEAGSDSSRRHGSLSGLGTGGSSGGTDGSGRYPNRPYLGLN